MPHNLLVIFGDEMRAHAMGCSGDPNVRTPNMDMLAAEGCRFDRAYTNTPVCTPARAMMLTGLYSTGHGAMINDLPVRTDVPTIARTLGDSGYRCGYVGKWHIAGIPRTKFIPPGPERLGFDDYWAVWNCHHDYLVAKYFLDEPEPVFADGYEPTVQTELALGFIDDHVENHPDSPFCAFLSWGPPHSPYVPWPPGSEGLYDPAAIELPPNCPETEEHRQDLAGYYAHTTALDAELGRILDHLSERGLADDTLVVFTSDHGSMLGSQGHYNKQQPWAESVRIPLIMRAPGLIEEGTTSDLLFGLMDFTPTMLGLLGAEGSGGMHGEDLSEPVAGRAANPDRAIYIAEMHCMDQAVHQGIKAWRALKTDRYTYARNIGGPWLLYDDVRDPYQLANLVDDPGMSDVRQTLDTELTRQIDEYDDALVGPDEMLDKWGLREAFEVRDAFLHTGSNMRGDWPGHPPRTS